MSGREGDSTRGSRSHFQIITTKLSLEPFRLKRATKRQTPTNKTPTQYRHDWQAAGHTFHDQQMRFSDTNLLDNLLLDDCGVFCSRSFAHILHRCNVSAITVNDWCAARRRHSVCWKYSASKSMSRTICNRQPPSTPQPQLRSLISAAFEDAVSPLSSSRAKCSDNSTALSRGWL